jgi:hypothetical protein
VTLRSTGGRRRSGCGTSVPCDGPAGASRAEPCQQGDCSLVRRAIELGTIRGHPEEADALVVTVTIDFWHAYLYGDDDALDALETDANVPGVTTLKKET